MYEILIAGNTNSATSDDSEEVVSDSEVEVADHDLPHSTPLAAALNPGDEEAQLPSDTYDHGNAEVLQPSEITLVAVSDVESEVDATLDLHVEQAAEIPVMAAPLPAPLHDEEELYSDSSDEVRDQVRRAIGADILSDMRDYIKERDSSTADVKHVKGSVVETAESEGDVVETAEIEAQLELSDDGGEDETEILTPEGSSPVLLPQITHETEEGTTFSVDSESENSSPGVGVEEEICQIVLPRGDISTHEDELSNEDAAGLLSEENQIESDHGHDEDDKQESEQEQQEEEGLEELRETVDEKEEETSFMEEVVPVLDVEEADYQIERVEVTPVLPPTPPSSDTSETDKHVSIVESIATIQGSGSVYSGGDEITPEVDVPLTEDQVKAEMEKFSRVEVKLEDDEIKRLMGRIDKSEDGYQNSKNEFVDYLRFNSKDSTEPSWSFHQCCYYLRKALLKTYYRIIQSGRFVKFDDRPIPKNLSQYKDVKKAVKMDPILAKLPNTMRELNETAKSNTLSRDQIISHKKVNNTAIELYTVTVQCSLQMEGYYQLLVRENKRLEVPLDLEAYDNIVEGIRDEVAMANLILVGHCFPDS